MPLVFIELAVQPSKAGDQLDKYNSADNMQQQSSIHVGVGNLQIREEEKGVHTGVHTKGRLDFISYFHNQEGIYTQVVRPTQAIC
jgi:hypothetical protein